jgi:hypothetical protein
VDEDARKAADLGLADGTQRGRISFEMVKGLIWSQVKDGPPNHARILQVYGNNPFRPYRVLQEGRKSCLPYLGIGAPYY